MEPFNPYRAPQPGDKTSLERDFDRFEASLKRLRVEYEKFFNGALPQPPEEQQKRLADELKRLRNQPQMSAAESFRLSGLEARYNSYSELFGRRLRDLEEGRIAAARLERARQMPDPEAGLTVREELTPEVVESLFAGLCRGAEPPRFDLDSFGSYLERQLSQIRQKSGRRSVRFRVEREGSKVKLKAKPIAD